MILAESAATAFFVLLAGDGDGVLLPLARPLRAVLILIYTIYKCNVEWGFQGDGYQFELHVINIHKKTTVAAKRNMLQRCANHHLMRRSQLFSRKISKQQIKTRRLIMGKTNETKNAFSRAKILSMAGWQLAKVVSSSAPGPSRVPDTVHSATDKHSQLTGKRD